jgi:hypothetical protein
MTTHSPVAQVEVESKMMREIEAEIEDLKKRIKRYENEYDEATGEERKDIRHMIIAARTNLHDLELKALRQEGNEQRTCPFILWFFHFQSIRLLSYVHILSYLLITHF